MGCTPEEECRTAYEESGILVYTLGFPIASIGLILNVITIIVILKQKSIRNHPLVPLIFFMTLNDLVMCIYGIPVKALTKYWKDWPFANRNWGKNQNDFICQLTFPPFVLPWLMSMILPLLASVNRALSLLYGKNFAMKIFSWRNTFIIFLVVSTTCFFLTFSLCSIFNDVSFSFSGNCIWVFDSNISVDQDLGQNWILSLWGVL